MDEQQGISISEAATRLGVSEKTIRRRVKSGELSAYKVDVAQGFEWRVMLSGQPAVHMNGHASTPAAQVDAPAAQPDSAVTLEALRLVEKLQQQLMEVSGRCGYLQAELAHRDARILLLEAGPAPTPPEEPLHAPEKPVEALPSMPWWKRWFALE